MGRRFLEKLIPFFVVLAVTIGLITVLSAASRVDQAEAADRYIRQVQSARQAGPASISAPAVGSEGGSFLLSLGIFLGLAAIPVIALLIYAKFRRMGRRTGKEARQSYRPRKDMSLQGTLGVKYRV